MGVYDVSRGKRKVDGEGEGEGEGRTNETTKREEGADWCDFVLKMVEE